MAALLLAVVGVAVAVLLLAAAGEVAVPLQAGVAAEVAPLPSEVLTVFPPLILRLLRYP